MMRIIILIIGAKRDLTFPMMYSIMYDVRNAIKMKNGNKITHIGECSWIPKHEKFIPNTHEVWSLSIFINNIKNGYGSWVKIPLPLEFNFRLLFEFLFR